MNSMFNHLDLFDGWSWSTVVWIIFADKEKSGLYAINLNDCGEG